MELRDSDIRIEWFSGTGPGGQNRNKSQCSCRLIHAPTGITATAQTRSRKNSFGDAIAALTIRVKNAHLNEKWSEQDKDRKTQMGTGMRGDKRRTFRFQDDTVKDHITNKSASCKQVMNGYFDLLW